MANLYLDLPVPLVTGAGASVNTASMGRVKTISYTGDIVGGVEVQVSADNVNFRTVYTFSSPNKKITLSVGAVWMRARVTGAGTTANMDVACNDNGVTAVGLPVTGGNGIGAPVDVSALGTFHTFLCSGAYTGSVVIEVSADGNTWNDTVSFGVPGGVISKEVQTQFARVRRSGVGGTPGTPVVNLIAVNDPSPAGAPGPPSGAAGGDLTGTYPNPTVSALTETGGPTSLVLGAIADGAALVRSGANIVGAAIPTLAGVPPVDVDRSPAATGGSSDAARADHKHDVATAAPVTIGTANASGSSAALARADHVHSHGAQTDGTLHALAVAGAPGVAGFISGADQQKLDNSGELASVPPANVTKSPAVTGASAEAARADHKHDVTTATAVELTDSTNSEGSLTPLARANHQHAHGNRGGGSLHATAVAGGAAGFISGADQQKLDDSGALASTAPANVDRAAAQVGVGTTAARADHKHDVATAAAGAIAIGDTAAEGTSTSLARADHQHGLAAPAAPADVTKAAASAGAATSPARADHKHDVATAAAGAIAIGDTAAEGASTSLARADHRHSLAAPTAPVNVTKAAASAGAATAPARADHKHDVTTAAAVELTDSTNAEGAATSLARSDHTHAHGARGGDTLHALAVAGTPGVAGFISGPDLEALNGLGANWPVGTTRYYAVDYDAGNDANLGYSDVDMPTAGTVAIKTLEKLRQILPSIGRGRRVVIAIAARAGGAVYRNIADTADDEIQLVGLSGYEYVLVRGTGTVATAGAVKFANDTADKIALGAQIFAGTNAAGYNPTGSISASSFDVQLAGGGAPGLSAEPALIGKRIRFDSATTTVALRNACVMVHANTASNITVQRNLPATPVGTDVFYIEEPGTTVYRIQAAGCQGATTALLPSFSPTGITFAGLRSSEASGGFVAVGCRSIAAGLRLSFIESYSPGFSASSLTNLDSLNIGYQYIDESATTITTGVGFVAENWAGTVSTARTFVMDSTVARTGRYQILTITGSFNIGTQGGCYFGAGLLFQNCKGSGGTQNTVGGSVLGNNASSTVRRTRLLGGFAGSCLSFTNAHGFFRGLEFTNVGALSLISMFGIGSSLVINDVVGSTGNTGNGLDMTLNRESMVLMGQLNANTFTGAAGQDIAGAGPVYYTHADVARTDVIDKFLNRVQGASSRKLGAVSSVVNNAVANVGQYKVVRATASGLVQAAQGNSAANAAGIIGVSQSAFTTVQEAMAVTAGGTWLQFDSAPTAGALAYLSTGTAGNAQTTLPTAPNVAVPLGRVLAVSGTLGYVAFEPEAALSAGALAHGQIYVSGGVTAQVTNATPGTFDKITGFTTNGLASQTTPDHTNDQITLTGAGRYKVSFTCSFSGTNNSTFECRAYLGGVAQTQCSLERKLGTGGDVGMAGFEGIVNATAGQVLDVRVAASGASDSFTPSEMSLTVIRVGD